MSRNKYISSPYKEIGLDAHTVFVQPHRRKEKKMELPTEKEIYRLFSKKRRNFPAPWSWTGRKKKIK